MEGQSDIREFAEEMPISNENSQNMEENEPLEMTPPSESRGREDFDKEQKLDEPTSKMPDIVPDVIDGECQYCAGNKDIETNDGSFHLHLTRHGTGRIELDSGLRYGIIEFSYCPMCGRKMEE